MHFPADKAAENRQNIPAYAAGADGIPANEPERAHDCFPLDALGADNDHRLTLR